MFRIVCLLVKKVPWYSYMLISLHLAKTAGSSFFTSLKDYYGNQLLRDYADLPMNTPVLKRQSSAVINCAINGLRRFKGVECIHGHFLPLKYSLYGVRQDVRFVTWMRDPAERLASNYYFWIRNYKPVNAPLLHRRVVEENWSLERFCLGPEFRNFYSQILSGFRFSRFDFIGIAEYYETELDYFSKEFLRSSLKHYEKNVNPGKARAPYFEDPNLRRKVEKYHSKDVALYKRALDIRLKTRCT